MPDSLLNVPHRKQIDEAGCLLACLEMVTEYLGDRRSQDYLSSLLEAMPEGTPASRVTRLSELGFHVAYCANGTMSDLETAIDRGIAPIVFFTTEGLEYWDVITNHAAVLVGLDPARASLNDPAFTFAPQSCSRDSFELAWMAFENRFALVTK